MPGSMTGYGHAEEGGYSVEIKGLNNRYKDIRVKLPRDMNPIEMQVRSAVSDAIHRGKADVIITRNIVEAEKQGLNINWDYAKAVFEDLRTMAGHFGGEPSFRDVIAVPGVTGEEEKRVEELWALISPVLEKALKGFLDSRMEEGEKLGRDMAERIQVLEGIRLSIEKASQGMPEIFAERLHSNINILLQGKPQVDEIRLAQEIAIMAERCDITEEVVRLKSHFDVFRQTLKSANAAGRRLEFILQEINREFNTIGSKSQDTSISIFVIDAKTELEKIREQLQNIE
ncbi:MAG TPA: YicC/YloC family endoribonuclease [Desulfomonilia bacterium]|jgi:uncharacterized protein (TIGR00255 family)